MAGMLTASTAINTPYMAQTPADVLIIACLHVKDFSVVWD
jgi:hypothetical protein